jgi:hypothetical protein
MNIHTTPGKSSVTFLTDVVPESQKEDLKFGYGTCSLSVGGLSCFASFDIPDTSGDIPVHNIEKDILTRHNSMLNVRICLCVFGR